jgi:ribose-phosphate pyrophosphokinase
VAATHGLFVGPATDRLRPLPVTRILTTDSVVLPDTGSLPHQRVSLAPLLADVVSRLHGDRSLSDLIAHA